MSRSAEKTGLIQEIEEILTDSELRQSSILKALPDLVFVIHKDGTYLDFHAPDERSLLIPPQEFLGRNVRQIMPPDIADEVFRCFEDARRSETPQCIEYALRLNGADQWFECRIVTAGPDKFLSIVRDVTAKKQTLKDLEDSLREFQTGQYEVTAPNEKPANSREAVESEKTGFGELFEFAPDGYVVTDKHGVILRSNRAAGEILRSPPNRQEGRPLSTFVAAEYGQALAELQGAMHREETSAEIEVCLGGEEKRYATIKVNRIASEPCGNLRWLIRDTTQQREAEVALQESELFNRRIIESSNDCIKILDLDGNLLYLNPRGRELLELGEDDPCIGSHWLEFWDDTDRAELLLEIEKAKTGLTGRFQGQTPTARGTPKWWDVMITPIAGVQRSVERLLVVSRDITEQKTSAAKLLSKQRFFRSLIENAHDIISVLDLDGTIIYESPACERIFGYTPDERIGINCFEYVHENDRPRVGEIFIEAVQNKASTEPVEYRYRHKNGSWICVEVIAKYSHDEAGKPVMIVNKRDITDRRRVQESLRESEERFYSFIDNSPAAIWITDEHGVLSYVNTVCRQAVQLLEPEMIGKSVSEIFPHHLAKKYRASIKSAAESGLDVQRLDGLIRGDGSMGSFIVYRFPITESQPRLIGGIAIDVTEQRRVEKELAISEEKYRRIVDTMHEGVWVLGADSKIKLANQQLADMLGYEVDELLDRPSEEFLVDDRSGSISKRKSRKNGNGPYTAALVRKDSTTVKILVSATPIYTDDGQYEGALAIFMDITERMRTHEQLERLTAKLLSLQDEERRRIARELHDGTAQNLAAIGINLSTLKQLSTSNGRLGKILDQTRELTDTALQEIRTMSYLLHPPMLEEAGLVSALHWFIDGYTDRTGIAVKLNVSGRVGRLSREIETAIYRIVQEGLNNVYRHSGSPVASVSVERKGSDVILKIRDEGRGLSNGPRVDSGVGIRGMKERLRLLGGKLDIVSGKGGTTLRGEIPLGGTK